MRSKGKPGGLKRRLRRVKPAKESREMTLMNTIRHVWTLSQEQWKLLKDLELLEQDLE